MILNCYRKQKLSGSLRWPWLKDLCFTQIFKNFSGKTSVSSFLKRINSHYVATAITL